MTLRDSPCDRCLDQGRECIASRGANNATACDPCRKLKKKCSHADAAPTGAQTAAQTRTRRPARKRRAVERESEDELGPETAFYFVSTMSEGLIMETHIRNVLKNVERYPDLQAKARGHLKLMLGI